MQHHPTHSRTHSLGSGLKRGLLSALLTLGLGGGVLAQTAATSYHVTIQAPASPSARPSGTLIFEFVGGTGALAATATLTNITFSGDYALDGFSAFGTAAAPVSAQNGAGTISNDTANANGFATDAAPFGARLSFDVSFSGPALKPSAPLPAAGSDFVLLLSDSLGNPLWTTDPQDRVLDISLGANGAFGSGPYSLSGVATVSATPEPSATLTLTAGFAALLGLGVRRCRRSARSHTR